MVKVIINADDCGISKHVDAEVRRYMENELISSTTIMANMEDFDGAVQLYKDFHDSISFGIHFNLTEGTPLTRSQRLIDEGYFIEKDGTIQFYGKEYDYRKVTKAMKADIYKELECQAQKILDSGIKISHFDSHHHVHFHRQILPVFCQLSKQYDIRKMRRCSNIQSAFVNKLKTEIWWYYAKSMNQKLHSSDYFCGISSFLKLYDSNSIKDDCLYEIMCHPGHSGIDYEKENSMMEIRIKELTEMRKIDMINYNKLNG